MQISLPEFLILAVIVAVGAGVVGGLGYYIWRRLPAPRR
jgi:preprotein translocase subunit Sss1